MAPWLAQSKWRNTLRMTRMASLCGCCYCAAAARKQMMICGHSPSQKKLKLWIQDLLKEPRKTQKAFLEWPHIDLCPGYWENVALLLLLEIEWGFGATILLRKVWNSGIRLYSKSQEKHKKLFWNGRPPEITPLGFCAVPQRCWWNCCWNADETTAEMLMNLLQECQWKYLARVGTRSPLGLRVRSPNRDTQSTK